MATTDGSERTIPRPRTYTSVLAVPRSTAMSRPPKPVSEWRKLIPVPRGSFPLKTPAKSRVSVSGGWFDGPEQHVQQQRHGQPDDVPVVTVDRLDDGRAAALDGVAACSAAPLAQGRVPAQIVLLERAEANAGRGDPGPLLTVRDQA